MKPSFHNLIPFFPLFCNCRLSSSAPYLISWQAGVSELDSIQFLCSEPHILAGWLLGTRLNSVPLLRTSYPGRLPSRNSTRLRLDSSLHFFISTLHGPRRKHSLSIVEKSCLERSCIATEVTRLLLAYSVTRECVYRVVA
jgi:hypothetical protein